MGEIDKLIARSIEALEKRDALSLRRISAEANSEAAIEGHRELILLALVDYSLSKMLSKLHYGESSARFYEAVLRLMNACEGAPKKELIAKLEDIEELIIRLDKREGNYSKNIMEKARIKKASKLYEQGLSLRRASELTGADPLELMDYVGGSKIHEFRGGGENAARLKAAREVFG